MYISNYNIIASALIIIINITGVGFTDIQTRFTSSMTDPIMKIIPDMTQLDKYQNMLCNVLLQS